MIERTTSDRMTTLRLGHGKASALDIELIDALGVGDDSAKMVRK